MKAFESSVSPTGQITLPAEVRAHLKLKPKDKVTVTLDGDEVTIAPARSRADASFQAVPALTPPRTPEEIEAIVEEEIAAGAAREGL